jgi:hypothetical protein
MQHQYELSGQRTGAATVVVLVDYGPDQWFAAASPNASAETATRQPSPVDDMGSARSSRSESTKQPMAFFIG